MLNLIYIYIWCFLTFFSCFHRDHISQNKRWVFENYIIIRCLNNVVFFSWNSYIFIVLKFAVVEFRCTFERRSLQMTCTSRLQNYSKIKRIYSRNLVNFFPMLTVLSWQDWYVYLKILRFLQVQMCSGFFLWTVRRFSAFSIVFVTPESLNYREIFTAIGKTRVFVVECVIEASTSPNF